MSEAQSVSITGGWVSRWAAIVSTVTCVAIQIGISVSALPELCPYAPVDVRSLISMIYLYLRNHSGLSWRHFPRRSQIYPLRQRIHTDNQNCENDSDFCIHFCSYKLLWNWVRSFSTKCSNRLLISCLCTAIFIVKATFASRGKHRSPGRERESPSGR